MNYFSVQEFETETGNIYENVLTDGEALIKNEGKPTVLMLEVSDDFDLILRAVRQARALAAVESMREIAAQSGYMTDEEIEAEIMATRQERRRIQ